VEIKRHQYHNPCLVALVRVNVVSVGPCDFRPLVRLAAIFFSLVGIFSSFRFPAYEWQVFMISGKRK